MPVEESMPELESMPESESEPPGAEPELDSGPVALEVNTHAAIEPSLCGVVTAQGPGTATVLLATTPVMAADAQGLVHGGFVFGAADYAAMVAVNDPHVVLGSADTRFTAPVAVGDLVSVEASVVQAKGRKRVVQVACSVDGRAVMDGTLTAFVLDAHVLDR